MKDSQVKPEHEPSNPLADADEQLKNLRPYGALYVHQVTGTKSDELLRAILDEGIRPAKTDGQGLSAVPQARRTPTSHGPGPILCQGLTWLEASRSQQFADGREDRNHKYLAVATNGSLVAFSTNSERAKRALRKWASKDEQGFVRPVPMETLRSIARGRRSVAAWLRNTNNGRASQFSAMAVAGHDVGQSAVAADLAAFLAGSVRVEQSTSDPDDKTVTVNPHESKLSFKRTDKITTWLELVELAFVWVEASTEAEVASPMLAGTADIAESLDAVGSPLDATLRFDPLDLDHELIESEVSHLPDIRFEVPPNQPAHRFGVEIFVNDHHMGEGNVELRFENGRCESEFYLTHTVVVSEAPTVRAAVELLGLDIRFDSEHLFSSGTIAHRPLDHRPFGRYRYADFRSTNIHKEKPSEIPAQMRRMIGTTEDDSLFGWAARTYVDGWLVCDDGPNETSDFVHLTHDRLTLIPIKAAQRGWTLNLDVCATPRLGASDEEPDVLG